MRQTHPEAGCVLTLVGRICIKRFHWSKAVWWACQDLNLGPHPYQAYSRDAFKLAERETTSSGWRAADRGCPLYTVRARLMWHASGMRRSERLRYLLSAYFPSTATEALAWTVLGWADGDHELSRFASSTVGLFVDSSTGPDR
jgi:hypothetical protein